MRIAFVICPGNHWMNFIELLKPNSHFPRAKALRKVVIFRKTPTFAVLQTALRSDFSSLPLFKGLHYYKCGKFTFPARGRSSRQIGGLFRKVRFSETQVIILIIMRKSKNDTFCFFTQFGNALPYGKRVNLRPCILCVPL